MRKYLGIYKEFIKTSLSEQFSFRLNFLLLIFMDMVFFFGVYFSVQFIYQHVDMIGPWKKDQLLFFVCFMMTLESIHMTIMSTNFWMLGRNLIQGNLDFVFLKPAGSIFSIFFRMIRSSSLITFVITGGFLIHYGIVVGLSTLDWILLPIFLLLSYCIKALVEIIISTAMFWTMEGVGINFLRMQLQQLSRWPDFVYKDIYRKVFTFFVPVLLYGSAANHFLFSNSVYLLFVLIVMISVLGICLNLIWKRALLRYESASS